MIGACDSSCFVTYFLSLPGDELLRAFVGLLIVVPMLATICHEAGHYYAAKLCGIDSEEFALGTGPAILRVRVTPSGCTLALRAFPFGGRVTYDERYWQVSYAGRAFMSAAGWMADAIVAAVVVAATYLADATGPVATAVCGIVAFRVAYNLLPLTGDGRKTLRYLWLAATDRAGHARRS
ncbi:MAG: M50 family metallopeptidase [Burkholderiaceae bacterium]|jgi:membrane-associated protease RseP (regulator of RpoE activity)|nr:M50 family metallopeptidase [Burkholderiaceae bacterium]